MSLANPLWGAPRIDGELLKLGTVQKPHPPVMIAGGGVQIFRFAFG